MQPEPSGHRRRRSTLINIPEVSAAGKSGQASRSPTKPKDIQEELKTGDGADDDDTRSTSENLELDDLSDDGLQDDEETGLTGKDKSRRKKKRRQNTLLDHRIAGDIKITDDEKKEADQNVLKNSLVNGILIGLWYLFSLSISIVSYTSWQTTFFDFSNVESTVQQVDVFSRSSRLPFPSIYDMYAYAGAILLVISRSIFPSTISTSI